MGKRRKSRRKRTTSLLLKFVFSMAGFFCLVGMVFFFLIYTGFFGPLPEKSDLADILDERATLVYSSDNILIGKIFAKNRTPVEREDLPQHLIDALIATEDSRFYEHKGIDSRSLARVFFKTLLMGDRSSGGGSTITQQLAKNLYGRKDFGWLTLPVNKVREAILARRLEEVYTKEEIILLYFNSVPFGENVYGIEAAANRYFNKHVHQLTPDESALLVGMLKGNTYYHPRLYPERALQRRNLVLELMQQQEKISPEMAEKYKNTPLKLDYTNYDLEGPAAYFLYQVEEKCKTILRDIKKENGKPYDIQKDGLKIMTTLDSRLQKFGRDAMKDHMNAMQTRLDKDPGITSVRDNVYQQYDNTSSENRSVWTWDGIRIKDMTVADSVWHYKKMLNAGMLVIEPKTGKIRVWIGGNHFRYLPYDLVKAERMVASAFKPVLYATALEKGYRPCDYFDNELKAYEEYDNWTPANYDKTSGDEASMWYSLSRSLNIPTVDLYFRTGFDHLEDMCYRLGIENMPKESPSISLGAIDLSLLKMVSIYAAFANQGEIVQPIFIEKIIDSHGKALYSANLEPPARIMDRITADLINLMLRKAINEGTGSQIRNKYQIRADLAGKTGTSQNFSDAWFFSFTPAMVCGVWAGARDPVVHFSSGAHGSGSALALPMAGKLIQKIESDNSLRQTYLSPFTVSQAYENMLDCEGMRTKGAINRFFEDVFGKKDQEEQDKRSEERPDTVREKGDSKVKRFFRKLFGKKDK